MTNDYTVTTINGFNVEIYETFHGTELYISKDGVQLYGHKVSGDPMEKARELVSEFGGVKPITKEEKLEKGRLVLMSAHIQEVEVKYLSTLNGSRYYQVRTWAGRHQYNLRFFEFEGERKGICTCASQKTCRHLIKAAQLDSEMFDTDFHFEVISNYKAGQRRVA
jgi:hypothetical protein